MKTHFLHCLAMWIYLGGCFGASEPSEDPEPYNKATFDEKACRYDDPDGMSYFYATEVTNKVCYINKTREEKTFPGQLFMKIYKIVKVNETVSYTVPPQKELTFPIDEPMEITFETLLYRYLSESDRVDVYNLGDTSLVSSLTTPECEKVTSKIDFTPPEDCRVDPYFNVRPQDSLICFGESLHDLSPVFTGLKNLNVDNLRKRFSSCTDFDLKEQHTPCFYKVDDSKKIIVDDGELYYLKTTEERKARCLEVYDLAKIAELTEIIRSLKPLEPAE